MRPDTDFQPAIFYMRFAKVSTPHRVFPKAKTTTFTTEVTEDTEQEKKFKRQRNCEEERTKYSDRSEALRGPGKLR
jgi:hypothetical protein